MFLGPYEPSLQAYVYMRSIRKVYIVPLNSEFREESRVFILVYQDCMDWIILVYGEYQLIGLKPCLRYVYIDHFGYVMAGMLYEREYVVCSEMTTLYRLMRCLASQTQNICHTSRSLAECVAWLPTMANSSTVSCGGVLSAILSFYKHDCTYV